MSYYHDRVTQKSWELLGALTRRFSFILIGGWAVYLYTRALKSKDIDIIVPFEELTKLREAYDLRKNDRLKKYEISVEETDVDIYVPHYSVLGLPVEAVQEHATQIEGFTVPMREALLLLKQRAWMDRGASSKGEKDRIDIVALLESGFDPKIYRSLIVRYDLQEYPDSLKRLLQEAVEIPELELNEHRYAALKRRILKQTFD